MYVGWMDLEIFQIPVTQILTCDNNKAFNLKVMKSANQNYINKN